MKFISRLIATFFGAGYLPVAPGTLTSLIVALLYKFYLYRLSWPFHLLVFFVVFSIGVCTSTRFASQMTRKDPRKNVIDEAAGQFLVLFRMDNSWPVVLSCFLLFRIFDIAKPFPIRKVERIPEGWGIMLDDVVAAVYAGIIINLYLMLQVFWK